MLAAVAMLGVAAATGCDQTEPTAPGARRAPALEHAEAAAGPTLGAALCSAGQAGFTIASTNPYYPLGPVGRQWILTGEEEGEPIRLEITVLDRTRLIEGVTTRVIEERESIGGELFEVSWNYFAQAPGGTICYFGEDVDIYEESGISHAGAWCAGTGANEPGIFMPVDPLPGMKFPIEIAPGVAEDEGKIVGIGPVVVPFDRFTDAIRIREFNPLDGGKDYKIYAPGTGVIVDGPLALEDLRQTSGAPGAPVPTDQACGVTPA
jgi:hypothetical protein